MKLVNNWAVKVHLLREPFKTSVEALRDCLKRFNKDDLISDNPLNR